MARNAQKNTAANDNAALAGDALMNTAPTNTGAAEHIVAPAANVEERKPIQLSSSRSATKSEKAYEVFNDCYKSFHTDPKSVPQRKDIINRLISEAGLTQNGAATYLQNMKKKAGLVASK